MAAEHAFRATEIEVMVSGGEVTLSGSVSARAQRRRAEDCVEAISGVKHVQNNLRVKEENGLSAFPAAGGRKNEGVGRGQKS